MESFKTLVTNDVDRLQGIVFHQEFGMIITQQAIMHLHTYGKPTVAIFNIFIFIQFNIYIYVIFLYSFNLIFIFV